MIYFKKDQPAKIWIGFLLFSSVYAFNLPLLGNSSYWSFALILGSLFLFNGSYTHLKYLANQQFFYYPIIILTFASLSAFLLPIFYQTYDISMLKTWINNLFAYFAMTVLACLFITHYKKHSDVFSLVFKILLIQVIIVWVMLAVPPVRDVIQSLTKSAAAMERLGAYGGSRGLGLTSFVAFSFSVIMGLLGLFMHYYFAVFKQNKSLAFRVVIFYLAIIAGISAGRTAVGGFAIGFAFYWFAIGAKSFVSSSMKVVLYTAIFISPLVFYIISDPALADIVEKYYRYAFQFIYRYFSDGYVGKSSLDVLDTMYFPLTDLQILLGDGRYTATAGDYYLQTDAGYMRFALLFGLLPSLIIYVGFVWIMFSYYLINRKYIEHFGILISSVIALTFIYHYKGEVIMFNVSFMKLIYFVFVTCSLLSLQSNSKQNDLIE